MFFFGWDQWKIKTVIFQVVFRTGVHFRGTFFTEFKMFWLYITHIFYFERRGKKKLLVCKVWQLFIMNCKKNKKMLTISKLYNLEQCMCGLLLDLKTNIYCFHKHEKNVYLFAWTVFYAFILLFLRQCSKIVILHSHTCRQWILQLLLILPILTQLLPVLVLPALDLRFVCFRRILTQ